ncbi:iron ABC transporter permease [Parvularcula sp. LCG005]|uniref:FecCD family ABC transporter permease n=1 Tax=Parvularcula sp. LCG005 TaxID=3078805 RepID=UPI002941D7E2|nr:iron ABC transporter permease [Parvularcula sp. LCG005]WOI52962.1 iron ABC transporter permease [Parvularcula sp. LCG005]
MTDRRLLIVLAALGLATIVASLGLGETGMGLRRLLLALVGQGPAGDRIVVWDIRLPRALAAFLSGAALGASGAALQGLLRNPLAEPGVLGVSAVSTLAATLTLYYGLASSFAPILPLAAVSGAMVATAILLFCARKVRSIVTLILIGVGITSFAGAVMALLLNFAPNPYTLSDMINWTLGSVSNRGLNDIALAGPFIALGIAILVATRRDLTALTLGEEVARTIGLDLGRARLRIVLGAGLATGGSIALAGTIGFVGIIAPHLVRCHVGHDPGRTVQPSALLAGLLVVAADVGVRLIPTSGELKLGVVAALIGAPLFIWIAARRGVNDE